MQSLVYVHVLEELIRVSVHVEQLKQLGLWFGFRHRFLELFVGFNHSGLCLLHGNVFGFFFGEHVGEVFKLVSKLYIATLIIVSRAVAGLMSVVKGLLDVVGAVKLVRHDEALPAAFTNDLAIFEELIMQTIETALVGIVDSVLSIGHDIAYLLLITVKRRRFSFHHPD